ncbi:TonB-dependent receptor [Rhodobacterales bacterium HKCCE3408]|nr:TonB-dependent receptor [Rhodobacterales bacterium HKCCE3408]
MRTHLSAVTALLLGTTAAGAQGAYTLDTIIFTATATAAERARVGSSVSVLGQDDLTGAVPGQLAYSLDALPGVRLAQNGPPGTLASFFIRGAQTRYIGVYIDGILVNDPTSTDAGFDDFGGIGTANTRRVELLRGSQSALYGGTAIAGVVNVTTLPGDDTPEGVSQSLDLEAGSFGTASLAYQFAHVIGDTRFSFGLSHARSDGFSAAEENAGNTEADGFDRSRLSFGVEHAVSDTLTVGLNGFYEDGGAEFDEFAFAPVDGTPDEESERQAWGLRAYLEAETGAWSHDAALSFYSIDRSLVSPTVGPDTAAAFGTPFSSDFHGERITLDYTASTDLSDTLSIALGADARLETAEYANIGGGSEDVTVLGAFAEATWSPSAMLDVTATLRHDDHSAFGGFTTGRLAFAYRPADGTVIRGAVGTGYRAPSLDELYGDYLAGAFPFQGNPNLTPEESVSAELGIEHSYDSGAFVSATVFRLETDNRISFVFGAPSTLENTPGVTTRQGLELFGSLPIAAGWTLDGAYTYTDTEQPNGAPLDNVPMHDLVLGLGGEFGSGWSGRLELRHAANLVDDGLTLPDYTVTNASIGYEIRDGLEVYGRIENLFDTQYQTVNGYGTSDRAFYVGLRTRF